MIEQIESPETKQTIARKTLEGLRDWFEVDESREKYILDCVNWIFLAAKEKDEYVGFLCLKETGKETVELAVMGVQKEFHRKGLGRQLFDSAKKMAYERGLIKEAMIVNCKVMFFNIWDVVSIYKNSKSF